MEKVVRVVLPTILSLLLIPFFGIVSHAEGGNNSEALEESSLESGINYKVGDIIEFGHYEQDGNYDNGKEPIEWQVLKVETDRIFVISKYALDEGPYSDNNWETCELREWLNNDFRDVAFTTTEQKAIPTVTVITEENQYTDTEEIVTQDQIFCLSWTELELYFGKINWEYVNTPWMYGLKQNLICSPTQYGINRGLGYIITEEDYNDLKNYGYTKDVIGCCSTNWALRSGGYVGYDGYAGPDVDCAWTNCEDHSIRPVMYIQIKPTDINLNKKSESMYCEQGMTLEATLTPSYVIDNSVTWSSSNPQVASVSDGLVHAKSVGTATISAKTVNGHTASCVISVSEANKTSYKVGDSLMFGSYEQDGNANNGKEAIEWEILKVESDRALLLSKYALDIQTYNDERGAYWESSLLRKWLNEEFKNSAFTVDNQERIISVNLVNKDYEGHIKGNNTNDQIFCLGKEELETLFPNSNQDSDKWEWANQSLLCTPTQYAAEKNSYLVYTITEDDYRNRLQKFGYSPDVIGCKYTTWWTRTLGVISSSGRTACCVDYLGIIDPSGLATNAIWFSKAVRPALYIKLPVVNPQSIALDRTSSTMYYGDSLTLNATLTPEDVTETMITWTSSNSTIATVNNGTVKPTGKGAGVTTITAKTVNGLTATCEITVFADDNPDNIFADIKYDTWKYKSAMSMNEKGYMTGKGTLEGRILFSPDTNIDRSQFVVALYSMDGKPETEYEQKFSDVKSGAWYAKQVTWASNNGIVAGNPDGTFGVYGKATREQLALMFYKYAMYKNYDVSVSEETNLVRFTDADKVSGWAINAIKWAVERGIISGKGSAEAGYRIDPKQGATRAECAAMMNKFDEVYSDGLRMAVEVLEDPLVLPEEETEDISVPEDEADEEEELAEGLEL